jgi:hypothetical protein
MLRSTRRWALGRIVVAAVAVVPVVVAAFLAFAGAASAKDVESASFCLGNVIGGRTVEATEPLIRDSWFLFGTGALVQHSMQLERVVNPKTMRGTVSGSLSGTGPDNHFGVLHGVVSPEGMSGRITMTRLRVEEGVTDKFVGSWTSEQLIEGPESVTFCFEGHFIVSP